jgi:tape measure domain-containing protein
MAEKVGELYYEITLDTQRMVQQQRQVDREISSTTRSLDGFESKLNQVAKAISAYAAALYLVRQSDAFTKLNAQLQLATDSSQQFARAQADVRRIAQEAQTDISGVGTLYARISTATKELGVNQAEVAAITRTVALALKVSGAGAQESASATLQLSQAFASGVLRGEEFNAVSEAAPRLMKALADGIGVPIGQLRAMAEQGKLTSEVLATALPKALADLEVEASKIQTISGAFQTLRNELMLFIGEQTTASGAAKLTADAITTLASNLDLLAAAAYGFAAAKLTSVLVDAARQAAVTAGAILDHVAAQQASRAAAIATAQAEVQRLTAELASLAAARQGILVAREQYAAELQLMNAFRARGLAMAQIGAVTTELAILGRQQASVTAQQTATTAALTIAQGGLAKATSAAGTATGLISGALGLLGGPIGAITTLLGLGVTAWALWGSASSDNEAVATEAVERSTEEITTDLDRQIAKLKERNALASAGLPGIAKQETEAAKRLAALQQQINDLQAGKGINGGPPMEEAARLGLAQDLVKQYVALYSKIQAVSEEQEKLSAAGTSSKLTQWMTKYASDAERAREEIAKAKKELGDSFTPELEMRIKEKYTPAKKRQGEKFDEAGYLAGLRKAQASEINAINETETEKLRINDKRLKDREISESAHANAVKLITEAAEQDRVDLMRKTQEQIDKDRKDADDKATTEIKKREDDRKKAMEYGAQLTKAVNPVDALRQEYQERLDLVTQYEQMMATAGVNAEEQGQMARTQLATEYELQRRALAEESFRSQGEAQAFLIDSLNAFSSTATQSIMGLIDGTMTAQDAMRALGMTVLNEAVGALVQVGIQQLKNALISQTTSSAMASAQTAAIATTTAAQVASTGTMAATSTAAAGTVAAAAAPAAGLMSIATLGQAALIGGAAIIGTMAIAKSFGGGRRYGGPVSSDSMYRVNESGRPEMFTASNGSQFMLPTANGKVTAADQVGAGGQPWTINIYGAPAGSTATVNEQARVVDIAVAKAEAQIAGSIRENSGPVWSALRSSTNVQSRL